MSEWQMMTYHFNISYLLFTFISTRGSDLLNAHLGTKAPIPIWLKGFPIISPRLSYWSNSV